MDAARHAAHYIAAGEWLATLEVGTVTLIYADRCRRRVRLLDDSGNPFLLDLVRPARLADGDGLVLADGTIIRVIAAPEPLTEAIATDARHLARLAWHVGNRHVPAQIVDERCLRILHDAVLEQMLCGLAAETRTITAPFHPEGGAYVTLAAGHHHGHD
ncbi:urease accessory protein UreE [Dongia deserti]|uniref:urease accessory protein UreE n=1 Tax=Dongia deserti TaxID=2268030 RepID=UPI000E6479EA|nr:urease accessory protein UreE [Dongia deserti]